MSTQSQKNMNKRDILEDKRKRSEVKQKRKPVKDDA